MKIEDLAYAVAGETLVVLEQKYHYRIPDEHKRDIQRTVQGKLNEILMKAKAEVESASQAAEAEKAEEDKETET
jgi:hypothetical protein